MSKIWDIEVYLQEKKVFVSGIDERPCHMDSYMACLEYKRLNEALKVSPFSNDELLEAAKDMLYFGYLSPMAGLTARYIYWFFNTALPETQKETV